jgi:hypothetical protein
MQPLDVGVFRSAKSAWRQVLEDYYVRTRFHLVDKINFPSLLKEVFNKAFYPHHATAGFFKTGLFPLDRSRISEDRLILGKTFNVTNTTESKSDDIILTQNTSDSGAVVPLNDTPHFEPLSDAPHADLLADNLTSTNVNSPHLSLTSLHDLVKNAGDSEISLDVLLGVSGLIAFHDQQLTVDTNQNITQPQVASESTKTFTELTSMNTIFYELDASSENPLPNISNDTVTPKPKINTSTPNPAQPKSNILTPLSVNKHIKTPTTKKNLFQCNEEDLENKKQSLEAALLKHLAIENKKTQAAKTRIDDLGGKVVTSAEATQILEEKKRLAEEKIKEKVDKAKLKAEKAEARAKKAFEAAEAAKLKAEKATEAAKLRSTEIPSAKKNEKKKSNALKVSLFTCYKCNQVKSDDNEFIQWMACERCERWSCGSCCTKESGDFFCENCA